MIYIVEDDAAIRELEQYALQSSGYDVQSFESSESCLLYTSPSPRDGLLSRMPSSA